MIHEETIKPKIYKAIRLDFSKNQTSEKLKNNNQLFSLKLGSKRQSSSFSFLYRFHFGTTVKT
jgi:hypothetical protein